MKHEDFLTEIKRLFSLDKMTIDDIQDICNELGNYIFVADNFIKIVRILLNIEAKIPVILMGETGVGKTKLLEMLATLYGKRKLKWERLNIHAGITDSDIVKFIEMVTDPKYEENKKKEMLKEKKIKKKMKKTKKKMKMKKTKKKMKMKKIMKKMKRFGYFLMKLIHVILSG